MIDIGWAISAFFFGIWIGMLVDVGRKAGIKVAEENDALRQRLEAAVSGGTGEWQRCPVCDGRGDHMRGFYDGPGPTSTDCTTRVTCRTCRGLGIICRPTALAAGDTISDGFGNTWSATCECGGKMQVVRPGKVQCSECG